MLCRIAGECCSHGQGLTLFSGHLGNEVQQLFSFAQRSCTAAKSVDLAAWQEELGRLQLPLLSHILLAEARASPGATSHWMKEDLG